MDEPVCAVIPNRLFSEAEGTLMYFDDTEKNYILYFKRIKNSPAMRIFVTVTAGLSYSFCNVSNGD